MQQEELQPADMLSLIQLLSLTSDIPSEPLAHHENSSHDNIQELSQHFISVADSIISEENTLKWQAIKEVAQNKQSTVVYHVSVVLFVYSRQRCKMFPKLQTRRDPLST